MKSHLLTGYIRSFQWLLAQTRPLLALLRMPLFNSAMLPTPSRFRFSVKEAMKSFFILRQRPLSLRLDTCASVRHFPMILTSMDLEKTRIPSA